MFIEKKKIYRLNPDADASRLLEIVKVNNEAIERGERCPICLGHTEGDDAAQFLTIDVGEGKNFTTDGEFILCDLEIDEAFAEAAKRHRGVSVELWSDNRVFPISLLAHNRPALELEPVRYSREGEHTTQTITEPETEEIEMDVMTVKNLIGECIAQSDLAAQIKSLTDAVSQVSVQVQAHSEEAEKLKWLFEGEGSEEEGVMPEEGMESELPPEVAEEEATESPEEAIAEDAEAEAGEHPELPPEEIEQIAEDHVSEGKGEETPKVEKEEEPEVEKNDMAMPSGTNTFVPSTNTGTTPQKKKKNYEELALESETYRLSAANQKKIANTYASQIEAVATEKNDATARLAEVERKYSMLNRKNELLVLANKYEFDVEAEMKLVKDMTDDQYETHKKLVVVRYSMPPVKKAPVSVGELPGDSKQENIIPQAKVAQVAKYAMEHKISWKDAFEKLK
jgi:hypothetical protein